MSHYYWFCKTKFMKLIGRVGSDFISIVTRLVQVSISQHFRETMQNLNWMKQPVKKVGHISFTLYLSCF